jgi:NAD(P)-dependent dehydrogenase (short-subunit alcohol dehydrogenase family)
MSETRTFTTILAADRILLGAGNTERGEVAAVRLEAEGMDIRFIRIDRDDPASVATAAKAIDERDGRLGVLVDNAGVTVCADGPPGTASLTAVRHILMSISSALSRLYK